DAGLIAEISGGAMPRQVIPASMFSHITCDGDITGDAVVDLSDLAVLLANFDASPATTADGDIDGDGVVGLTDLAMLLAAFDSTCP
ncbi:MAG: hypothetical protein D6744_09665, partial [Planctomycetota bacterium]